jgi:hypothetical protein
MPPPEPPEPPVEVDVGSGRLGRDGNPGRLGSPGNEGRDGKGRGTGLDVDDGFGAGAELCVGSGNEGSGSDGSGFEVEDGFGAEVELCVGNGNDGRVSEGSGSGSEAPDDDEAVGRGGNKPAKAGAPVSIRARVPAATVPARRAALLGIVGRPPGRFLEIANEPLPGK